MFERKKILISVYRPAEVIFRQTKSGFPGTGPSVLGRSSFQVVLRTVQDGNE